MDFIIRSCSLHSSLGLESGKSILESGKSTLESSKKNGERSILLDDYLEDKPDGATPGRWRTKREEGERSGKNWG